MNSLDVPNVPNNLNYTTSAKSQCPKGQLEVEQKFGKATAVVLVK